MQLCDNSKFSVVNVYMPPAASVRRKHITADSIQNAVHDVVSRVPHTQRLVVCGDFNARTGQLTVPDALGGDTVRTSCDTTVCARGRWLV